jgi:hypothetical protein
MTSASEVHSASCSLGTEGKVRPRRDADYLTPSSNLVLQYPVVVIDYGI